jgi:membrane protease YdiL (CAAX protease family)
MVSPGETARENLTPANLLAYFLLTFAFTWTAWWASAEFAASGGALFGLGGPVFLLGVFAPALVAIAFAALHAGRDGVVRLLAPIGWWQVGARWYAFAIAYTAAIKLLAALIHRFVTGGWPVFGTTPWLLMLGAILVSTWVQSGEEVGWRGYALPRLARYLGLAGASIVLGVVWAVWHLPLFFLPGSGSDGQSFPIYVLHVTAVSVAMAWLFWRTGGSLLLVMVMHASVNNTIGIVPAALPDAVSPWSFEGSPMAWITVGLSWVVAAVLLLQMRGKRLVR